MAHYLPRHPLILGRTSSMQFQCRPTSSRQKMPFGHQIEAIWDPDSDCQGALKKAPKRSHLDSTLKSKWGPNCGPIGVQIWVQIGVQIRVQIGVQLGYELGSKLVELKCCKTLCFPLFFNPRSFLLTPHVPANWAPNLRLPGNSVYMCIYVFFL